MSLIDTHNPNDIARRTKKISNIIIQEKENEYRENQELIIRGLMTLRNSILKK